MEERTEREKYIESLEAQSNEELFGEEELESMRQYEIENRVDALEQLDDSDLFGEDYLDELRQDRIDFLVEKWDEEHPEGSDACSMQ